MAERDCKRNFKWPSMQRWQVSVVKKPKLKISVFEITNINIKCILDQTKLFRIPLWIYKSSSAILALKVTFYYVYSPFQPFWISLNERPIRSSKISRFYGLSTTIVDGMDWEHLPQVYSITKCKKMHNVIK